MVPWILLAGEVTMALRRCLSCVCDGLACLGLEDWGSSSDHASYRMGSGSMVVRPAAGEEFGELLFTA